MTKLHKYQLSEYMLRVRVNIQFEINHNNIFQISTTNSTNK